MLSVANPAGANNLRRDPMEQSDLKVWETELKQKEAELIRRDVELRQKEAEVSFQQSSVMLEQQKFDKEINRQELLRRAIEVASNAFSKMPRKELEELLTKAAEKLDQAIEAL
jgi:hypothetical protein